MSPDARVKRTRTQAFVLRAVDYGDRDVIVTLLGRDTGKFSALARSAKTSKKRFGGSLLPMRVLDATAVFRPNRELATLEEATVARGYDGLESTFEKIAFASYGTELVRVIVRDGDDSQEVFDALDHFYTRLADADPTPAVLEVLTHHFEFALLDACGASPSLDGCHRCGLAPEQMERLRCGRSGAGLVCQNCVRRNEAYGVLDAQTLEVLRYIRRPVGNAPGAVAEPAVLAQARRVIEASLAQVVDSELKSRGMLEPFLAHAA